MAKLKQIISKAWNSKAVGCSCLLAIPITVGFIAFSYFSDFNPLSSVSKRFFSKKAEVISDNVSISKPVFYDHGDVEELIGLDKDYFDNNCEGRSEENMDYLVCVMPDGKNKLFTKKDINSNIMAQLRAQKTEDEKPDKKEDLDEIIGSGDKLITSVIPDINLQGLEEFDKQEYRFEISKLLETGELYMSGKTLVQRINGKERKILVPNESLNKGERVRYTALSKDHQFLAWRTSRGFSTTGAYAGRIEFDEYGNARITDISKIESYNKGSEPKITGIGWDNRNRLMIETEDIIRHGGLKTSRVRKTNTYEIN